jgi:CubicO group peptidase (beta-lactamase class C family)
LLTILSLVACTTTFNRMLAHGTSTVWDFRYFPFRTLKPSPKPWLFKQATGAQALPNRISFYGEPETDLDALLESNGTLSFLVLHDDTILYERYFNGHDENKPSSAFSMTKSFQSLLVGCALEDGYLRSVRQPVTDYLPEMKRWGWDKVTIEHLLQMTSGMAYYESDVFFDLHPRLYWGDHMEDMLLKIWLDDQPGRHWRYKSGESQLLGLILSRALKNETITDYMQRRIWNPLGMEFPAQWSLDREGGLEKTFCCLSGTARDFAKIGRLYLNDGNWGETQIVPASWVRRSTKIDTKAGSPWNYQYQWWLASEDGTDFMAGGHLGQYLYVYKPKRLIIVRMGTDRGKLDSPSWRNLFAEIVRHAPVPFVDGFDGDRSGPHPAW